MDIDTRHLWTSCVYVRNRPFTKATIQRKILGACGGQSKVYCSHHNYPMICVPSKSKTRPACQCYTGDLPESLTNTNTDQEQQQSGRCKHLAMYTCPVENCQHCICNIHYNSVLESDQSFYVNLYPRQSYYGQHPLEDCIDETRTDISFNDDSTVATETTESSSDHHTESSSVNMPLFNAHTEEEDPLEGLRIKFSGHNMEDTVMDDTFLLEENAIEEFMVTCADEYDDDPLFTDDIDGSDCSSEYQEIPTTNAGTRPIYSAVKPGPYHENRTSNHVILNHYGSCLIRRNSQLHGTMKNRNFLQGITATCPGESVPLVYPEGMIFSDVFFLDQPDGSTVGALPAASLHDDNVNKRHGLAGLQDTFRTRMSNPGLLASSNPKYHFYAFDNLINLGLRGCDSRMVMRRGFAEHQGDGGVKIRGNKDPIFDTEQVDCRPIVNQLAAAIGEEPPTYFYTHTASMKTHFGIKLIWEWLMSDDLLNTIGSELETCEEQEHLRECLIDSAGVLMLRAWMEMIHVWILYITKSPEQPLGDILKFFFRMELQEAMANLPHMHSILWTKDDLSTKEGMDKALDRIRGFLDDIIRPDEREEYIENGLFENEAAVTRFIEMMGTILPHKHLRRCFTLAKSSDDEGEKELKLRCKVPNNFCLNPSPGEHSFIPIQVEHSQEAIHVMQTLGVAKKPSTPVKEGEQLYFEPLLDSLKAVKHVPPAHGNEGIISPVPGRLVACNPNTSNLQFTTGYFLSRYLAKYVASIDAYNVIRINTPKPGDDPDCYGVEGTLQLNTKITGNKLKMKKNARDKDTSTSRQARAINVMETYMMMFGYDPIIKNLKFINIPTQPYEERSARTRTKPLTRYLDAREKADGSGPEEKKKQRCNELLYNKFKQNQALTALDTIPCHHIREQIDDQNDHVFEKWRRFSPNQVKKAEDDLQSPLSTDPVTAFSLRPPELRCIMHQDKYNRWFKRIPQHNPKLQDQIDFCRKNLLPWKCFRKLAESLWIDATCATVKLRIQAIDEVIEYLETAPLTYFHPTDFSIAQEYKLEISEEFQFLKETIVWEKTGKHSYRADFDLMEACWERLLCEYDEKFLPTIWFRSVRPTQPTRFLIHLLLSYGAFEDEYTLFNKPSLRDSYIYAGLLDDRNPIMSAIKLAKKYLTSQLIYLPAGTITFDRYLVCAYNTIKSFFEDNTFYSDELPSVMYCRLADDTKESMESYKRKKKQDLVKNLLEKLKGPCGCSLPTLQECMEASVDLPLRWDIASLQRPVNQPQASFIEQRKLLILIQTLVEGYINATNNAPKSLCVVGAGGVGKTTAQQIG